MRATTSSRGADRISSNHPSERARMKPSRAETATSARNWGRSTPCAVMVGDQGANQAPGQAVHGSVENLGGGVGTDDGLKDRARATPVGPGNHHVGHMFQSLVSMGTASASSATTAAM